MNQPFANDFSNDIRYADWRHPVDFIEPEECDSSENSSELIQVLIWCDCGSLAKTGMRLVRVIHSRRPDFFDETRLFFYAKTPLLTSSEIKNIGREANALTNALPGFAPESLVWGVQTPKIEDIGFRVIVMLHLLRNGDMAEATLEKIAALKGFSKQRAGILAGQYRALYQRRTA